MELIIPKPGPRKSRPPDSRWLETAVVELPDKEGENAEFAKSPAKVLPCPSFAPLAVLLELLLVLFAPAPCVVAEALPAVIFRCLFVVYCKIPETRRFYY